MKNDLTSHNQSMAPDWSVIIYLPWQDSGHNAADMDSSTLEQRFLNNAKDVVEFKASSQTYFLSFEGKYFFFFAIDLCFVNLNCYYVLLKKMLLFLSDMIQTNKKYGTKRLVRRRPKFVSAPDVQTKQLRQIFHDYQYCLPCNYFYPNDPV